MSKYDKLSPFAKAVYDTLDAAYEDLAGVYNPSEMEEAHAALDLWVADCEAAAHEQSPEYFEMYIA